MQFPLLNLLGLIHYHGVCLVAGHWRIFCYLLICWRWRLAGIFGKSENKDFVKHANDLQVLLSSVMNNILFHCAWKLRDRDKLLLPKFYIFFLLTHYAIFDTTLCLIFLHSLNTLPRNHQTLAWKLFAKDTLTVQRSIRSELATQDCIPDKWKACMKNIMLKSLTKAAEKYVRKVWGDNREICQHHPPWLP